MKILNLQRAAQLMQIGLKLSKLPGNDIFTRSIKTGLNEGKTADVVRMIQEQHRDNPELVEKIIGEDTITKILSL